MANLYVADGYVTKGYLQTGISVNWGTGEIFVPISELTLVQETPTLIYELDLNFFRLTLKDLEDDPEGMPYPFTHIHNTEVSLGGLTYARVIEIVEPYTVTFEDGQYAVNLVGANSNVGDRVNVNQVSVRSANSAGMTSSPDIEHSSFNERVVIDVTSSYTGTIFPTGTPRQPVNNLTDAKLIANYRGFDTYYIIGNIEITTGDDISDIELIGQSPSKSNINVLAGAEASNCAFLDCTLTGVLDGNSIVKDSIIVNLSYIYGFVYNCLISEEGVITLGGSAKAYFLNCYSGKSTIHATGKPTIDCGGDGTVLVMHNYNGDISIKNKTGIQAAMLNLNAGAIEIQASCTAGTIQCEGIGSLDDYSLETCTVYSDNLMNSSNIAKATLSADLSNYIDLGTAGESLAHTYYNGFIAIDSVHGSPGTDYPVGTIDTPVNNLADAFFISQRLSIYTFGFSKDEYTFNATDDLRGYRLFAQSAAETLITVVSGCGTENTIFEGVSIQGTMNGRCTVKECLVKSLHNFEGWMIGAGVKGSETITFAENNNIKILVQDCHTIGTPTSIPTFDFSNIGTEDVTFKGYVGALSITNKIDDQFTSLVLEQGVVSVSDTCVSGTLKIAGNGILKDYSNGTIVDTDNLFNSVTITESVLDYDITNHQDHGTLGGLSIKAAYEGKITIDQTEGTAGTMFPVGMPQSPVNNLPDALELLDRYHLSTLSMVNDLNVPAYTKLNGLTIVGGASIDRTITIENTAETKGTIFKNLIATGTVNGRTEFVNCFIEDLYNFKGTITKSTITGELSFNEDTGATSLLIRCNAYSGGRVPDFSINSANVTLIDWIGWGTILNKTGSGTMGVSSNGARLTVDTSCINGKIIITGHGNIIDNSDIGCEVDYTGLLNNNNITDHVWDEQLSDHTVVGSTGEGLTTASGLPSAVDISNTIWDSSEGSKLINDIELIKQVETGKWELIDNQMIFYKEDNTTEVLRFNLYNELGIPAEENVYKRVRV